MVRVRFIRDGQELGSITVGPAQRVRTTGDVSWLDFDLMPHSERLDRAIAFAQDPQEWARCLPAVAAESGELVAVVDELTPDAPPRLALVGSPKSSRRDQGRRPVMLAITVVILACVVGLVAVERDSAAEFVSSTPPGAPPTSHPAAAPAGSATQSDGRKPRSTAGSATPVEPTNPAVVALTAAQLGGGFRQRLLPRGKDLTGEATLDECGMTFASEALRVARVQDVYRRPGGSAWVSDEVVRYRPGGAQEALSEARYAVAHCPSDGSAVGPAGDAKWRKTRIAVSGLLPDASSWKFSTRIATKSIAAIYVFEIRGDYLSGIYVWGRNASADEALARRAADLSAANLKAHVPPGSVSVPPMPARIPETGSIKTEAAQYKVGFVASCANRADARLPAGISASEQASARARITDFCTCTANRLEEAMPISRLLRESLDMEEHKKSRITAEAKAAARGCLSLLEAAGGSAVSPVT